MNKKRRIVLFVIGIAIIFVLIKVVLDAPYRSQIPSLSDLQSLTPSLQEQLTAASRKAYLNPTSQNLGLLGMVYHSSANYEKAAVCYKLAVKKDKSEWIWYYYLGYLNREMGESNAAIENFGAVITKNPNVYQASYYLGEEYQNAGNNQQAEKAFSSIINQQNIAITKKSETRYDYFPLGAYASFQLARIYFNTQRFDETEKTLKDLIKNNRSFGPAYRLLGNVYQKKGDTLSSNRLKIRASDMAVYSSPIDTLVDKLVLMSRSELYLLKKIDEAEKSVYPEWAMKLVNIALQYLPENKFLISKAIRIYIIMDKVDQAIPFTDQNIKANETDFKEMKSVGDLYYQKGYFPQAVIYYSKAAMLIPEDAEVQFCLILSLWKEGKRQEAMGTFDVLIEKSSKNVKVLAEGASMLLYLGEKEKAIVFFHKLVQLSPSDPKVQKLMGMIAEMNGKLPEAVKSYELAFKGDPKDVSTIRSLGNILMKQKLWEKSISLFRKALEYHPNDSYFLERLGTLLVSCPDPKLRNINEGLEFSERAFINTSSHASTLISAGRSLAVAYASIGDKQNAYIIMGMTLNAARREHLSESNIEGLKKLMTQFHP